MRISKVDFPSLERLLREKMAKVSAAFPESAGFSSDANVNLPDIEIIERMDGWGTLNWEQSYDRCEKEIVAEGSGWLCLSAANDFPEMPGHAENAVANAYLGRHLMALMDYAEETGSNSERLEKVIKRIDEAYNYKLSSNLQDEVPPEVHGEIDEIEHELMDLAEEIELPCSIEQKEERPFMIRAGVAFNPSDPYSRSNGDEGPDCFCAVEILFNLPEYSEGGVGYHKDGHLFIPVTVSCVELEEAKSQKDIEGIVNQAFSEAFPKVFAQDQKHSQKSGVSPK